MQQQKLARALRPVECSSMKHKQLLHHYTASCMPV